MNKLQTFLTLVGLSSIALPQVLVQGRVKRQAGDISCIGAGKSVGPFLDIVGLPKEDVSQMRAHLMPNYRTPGGKNWIISGELYQVYVDASSGRVVLFENLKRRDDRFRKRNRTGKVKFAREEEARVGLMALAKRLGVSSSAKITTFSYVRDGHRLDQDSGGFFGAVFKTGGRIVATVSCDIQDGAPLTITLNP